MKSGITFLKAPVLESIPGLVHAFSTRRAEGEDLTFGGGGRIAAADLTRFMAAAELETWPLARLKQIHSNIVHEVAGNTFPGDPPEGDAAETSLRGVAIGIMTADCVPVLIADRRGRRVAAAHAGWRGTAQAVVRKTVEVMASRDGIAARDLWAAIGPHIGVCCMEVGEEVVDRFSQPEIFERRPGWTKPHLDLGKANRLQMIQAGIPPERIQVSTLCTRCRGDMFHSYRRDGNRAGRMLSVIGLQP